MVSKSKEKDSKDSKHARCSPSAASRWVVCPGSVSVSEGLPDTAGEAAREGTFAHELAEVMLVKKIRSRGKLEKETGLAVGDVMFEHCLEYCKYIESLNPTQWNVEDKVPLFYSHEETGTVDFWTIDKYGVLHVVDLKYGQGVKVGIQDNLQLIIYALSTLSMVAYSKEINLVRCHVYQPRMNNCGFAEYSIKDLLQHRNKIEQAEKATWSSKAPLLPSESGCKWCKARGVCPAVAAKNLKNIGSGFDDLDSLPDICSQVPDKVDDDKLFDILKHKKSITSWLNAMEKYALDRLTSGEQVVGVAIKRKKGRKVWKDDKEVIERLTKMGMGGIIKTSPPTPLQTLAFMKKEKAEVKLTLEVEKLTHEKEGGVELVFEY